jgi:cell division protein FtsI (penicillin-binding protein 3)
MPVWRARAVLLLLLLGFALLIGRAAFLQGLNDQFLQKKGESRYSRVIDTHASRGKIVDRHGEALAVSAPVKSLWAIPGEVRADTKQLRALAAAIALDPAELKRKLATTERDFVYLKRQISPEAADKVLRLGLPGIAAQDEYRRYYPAGEVAAHVVGFTGVDGIGQEGIELAQESELAGTPGSRRVIKDRRGHIVEDVESVRESRPGRDLTLALDNKLQYLAYSQLKQAVLQHRAKAGGVVVLDVDSGEILAMANLPSFNPNNRGGLTGDELRNRAVTDTFEPGSTLKPVTVATALELGKVKATTPIQTAPGTYNIGRATISDAHVHGILSVAQVIQKSSNVGSAKIALALRPAEMWHSFDALGFGFESQLGFPGEAAGKLRAHATWRPIEQATMSYGHGISVSLLQLARAYLVFARDGDVVPLSLLKRDGLPAPTPVYSPATARAVRAMLELAVAPGGTAPRAQIMGYRVAGKTGTAHKLGDGGYAPDRYVSSFVGFAPASKPRFIVAVMIDEPRNGQYYGGAVAAPVFSAVVEGALRSYGIAPDAPAQLPPADDLPAVPEGV